jgi:hypothetical protein
MQSFSGGMAPGQNSPAVKIHVHPAEDEIALEVRGLYYRILIACRKLQISAARRHSPGQLYRHHRGRVSPSDRSVFDG